jgi:hypothetical protein
MNARVAVINSRFRTALVFAGALALIAGPLAGTADADAATAAGTVISNTATASYTDANSTAYATQSNTVTTTVWNAPSMTVSNPAAQSVAASDIVTTNAFVLTNTGNANGKFVVTADAAFSGSAAANATLANAGAAYIIVGGTTCTVAVPCTLANLNTALAGATYNAIAPGSTVNVQVQYKVANSTTPTTGTITTTLTADIVYPVNGAIPATTSATASGAESDNLLADARLDIQKAVTAPASSGANIVWTINANNGGGFAARDLTSVKTFLGSANPGVMIVDKLPAYGGTTLTLVNTTAVTTCPAGDTCTLYYSATGAAGSWSTTFSATANYIAVLLSGNVSGLELASNPAGSTGAGTVSAPQVVISVVTGQPSGSGSADANSVSNIANSVIGGNKDSAGDVPVIAPTIAAGTFDATSPALTGVEANTTPSTGTTPPGGASNTVSSQAYPQWTVYNGPYNLPAATGNYGGGASTNMLDFTEYGFACTVTPATGGTCTNASITIPMTVQNTSTKAEPLVNLTATAPPSGWTVAFYAASACAGGGATFPSCTKGSSITSFTNVASGASVTYLAVYTATNVAAFTPQAFDITATGTGGTGTGAETNDSYDVLYPGGALKITKSVVATTTNCPAGASPVGPANGSTTAVCPGGVLTYSLAYQNLAPAGLATGGTGLGTEPAFATNSINLSSVLLTEDGSASCSSGCTAYTNNWGSNTYGLNAAPADSLYTTKTTFTPSSGTAYASGTYPTMTAGYTKFTAGLNATGTPATVKPGDSGTITFNVTVK